MSDLDTHFGVLHQELTKIAREHVTPDNSEIWKEINEEHQRLINIQDKLNHKQG